MEVLQIVQGNSKFCNNSIDVINFVSGKVF
jgi:hypothetical protein